MNYNIQKLKEVNPELSKQLGNYCYDIVGCCQAVHNEMGPFLNEYMYQEGLDIVLTEQKIIHEKEHYFSIMFHNHRINHKHYVDFLCKGNVYVECKAVEKLCTEHRQQLWNYMRLSNIHIGILYNFAPVIAQCERYYLDENNQIMFMF